MVRCEKDLRAETREGATWARANMQNMEGQGWEGSTYQCLYDVSSVVTGMVEKVYSKYEEGRAEEAWD